MGSVVRVRLFAPFDQLCGQREVSVEVPESPTVAEVLMRLVEQQPALEGYILKRTGNGKTDFENYFLACVGEEIVLPDEVLPDGAEVKLFVPHAGG